jgi:4-hydroxy-3-methylbut-2-enyl diphosphate reductase
LNDVPEGATLVFSAHGVPKEVEHEAVRRGFRIFDATCPLVTKVHVEVAKLHKEGYEFIMIGHKGHPRWKAPWGNSLMAFIWWKTLRMCGRSRLRKPLCWPW